MLAAACLLTALALPGAGRAAPAAAGGPVPVTDTKCLAGVAQKLWVPTRAGDVSVTLTVPRSCPDAARQSGFPVLLTYTPYQVLYNGSDPNSELSKFGKRGYARAVADVIGTGNSGGCWDYGGERERQSAYDLVEWLAAQPWSNGKVAMIGASYDGTTANMAAVEGARMAAQGKPSHLATIVPQVAISDWYSYAYGDGVRYFAMDPVQRQGTIIDEQGFDTPVSFDFNEGVIPPLDRNDPNIAQHAIERPCPGMTDKLDHTARGYSPDPDYDEFWRARGYINEAANVNIPVLVEGGWRDYNVKHSESSRWFSALANAPYKMLVMGQQAHGMPDFGNPDLLLHAWFDQFLYGFDTGIATQPMSQSKTNDGIVRTDATWPPPGTEPVAVLNETSEIATLLADPGTMTESGALALRAQGWSDGGALWAETAPLTADVRIAGVPALDVRAATYGTSTHFTPVLFDLGPQDPDVTKRDSLCSFAPPQDACVMSRGFLNARYRNGLARGEDLTPGEEYSARVRFLDNDWVVKAGHRIGMALMASNAWWATPNVQRAPSKISSARLSLPIVGGAGAARAAGL
jgi:X-Pro dipeptidyl-peptidase